MTILIDGNNLIHKSENLKNLFQKDKEASQLSLIETVKSKISRTDKVIIFFDGFGSFKKPDVFFSEKDTADNIIRKRIESFGDYKKLKVVSSDHGITGLAKKCGCTIQKSEDFIREIYINNSPLKDKDINEVFQYGNKEKPSNSSKKDLDFFKKLFT